MKNLPEDARRRIGQVLVHVAAADGVITHGEQRALERTFRSLGLRGDALAGFLTALRAPVAGSGIVEEPTVQEAIPGTVGEVIPPVPGPAPAGVADGFVLDMARVARISQETREVIGLLSAVMTTNADEDTKPPAPVTLAPLAVALPVVHPDFVPVDTSENAFPTWLETLDPRHQPMLRRLRERDAWSWAEFTALAAECHLMPLGAFDVINAWADEALGDFLLEGEDPVTVRRELLPAGDENVL